MNMTDPDRRHLHDLEDQLARMTTRAEKAEAKLDECVANLWGTAYSLCGSDRRIADLEAELAAHRAEAGRPIGVGDEDLYRAAVNAIDWLEGVADDGAERDAIDQLKEAVGRAVRMPDGSPVPEIGGGA